MNPASLKYSSQKKNKISFRLQFYPVVVSIESHLDNALRCHGYLRLSCSICWMELERVRPCGAGGPVGRCHVVVLFT